VLRHAAVDLHILIGDALGFIQHKLAQLICASFFFRSFHHRHYPLHRPGQVDRRRARGLQQRGCGSQIGEQARGRVGSGFESSQGQAKGGGRSDGGRAAHGHILDRLRHGAMPAQGYDFESARQNPLVDHFEMLVFPEEGAHVASLSK
jgi:hypothetical protein